MSSYPENTRRISHELPPNAKQIAKVYTNLRKYNLLIMFARKIDIRVKMNNESTIKQENFCLYLIETGNAS